MAKRIFFTLSLLLLSIGLATGQNDGSKFTIGLNLPTSKASKVTLKEALQKLKKSYNVNLLYSNKLVQGRHVNPVVLSDNFEKDLTQLLKPFDLTFNKFAKNSYAIFATIRKNYSKKQVVAQNVIKGSVTDASTGDVLPGVNIQVKGTTIGTSTGANGHYSLQAESLKDTLLFSFIGYKTKTVPIKGHTTIDVALTPTVVAAGNQLVVVGYGTQKKENMVAAVSQINSKDIETSSVNNTVQALRGLAPGLNIGITGAGGEADAGASLNIRGTGSLSGSKPYIVIDGVRAEQSELAAMNPNDIESVSVLKGPAASAIYGSHAAFGAIVVTTKSGNENQPAIIDYSTNIRFKRRIFVPPTVNSLEYAKYANQARKNANQSPFFTNDQLSKIKAYLNGELPQSLPDETNSNQWLGIGSGSVPGWRSGYANTNWSDVAYKNLEITQKHNLSIKGGTDNVSYYLSGGFLKDPGQLKYGAKNEYYNKYNLNSNLSVDVTDWLTISNITRYTEVHNSFPNSLNAGQRGRIYHDIMRMPPLVPYETPSVKDSTGAVVVPAQTVGVAGVLQKSGFNRYKNNNLVTTLRATLDITDNLIIKGNFTFKKHLHHNTLNFKKWPLIGPDGRTSLIRQDNSNRISQSYARANYKSFDVYGHYNKTFFNNHNFKITLGYQQEARSTDNLSVMKGDVIVGDLNTIDVATGEIRDLSNNLGSYASLGAFARVNYNYKEKYSFEFDGRYDGSSRFAPDHRFVFSPSFALGYNISNEKFWKPVRKIVSKLKLRASYGQLGNQDVSNNLYLLSIPIHSNLGRTVGGENPMYTSAPGINSPNITWETVTSKDAGVDIGFLNNRLTATADVYERDTDNMFGPIAAVPAVLGTAPPQTNSASLRTRGWGISLKWRDQVKRDLSYFVNLMASSNLSTITKYHNPNKVLSTYYVGQKLGEIWGFKVDGLFQSKEEVTNYLQKVDLNQIGTNWQPGDVKYRDLNGDKVIDRGDNTVSDPGDRVIIGNNHPRYHFSIMAGASWKGFNLSMLWQGIGKRDVWPSTQSSLFWGWSNLAWTHVTPAVMNYWSKDNPDGYLPIPINGASKKGFAKDRHESDRYLQNGAYIRLKSLRLSYTLPSSLTEKINISDLSIFVNGENLVTFTNLWPNIDPELVSPSGTFRQNAGMAYPLAQTFGVGIDISF